MSEQSTSDNGNTAKENAQSDTGDLDYGYDFYPERRGGEREKGLWKRLTEGRSHGRKLKCFSNVHWCVRNSEYMSSWYINVGYYMKSDDQNFMMKYGLHPCLTGYG